VPALKLWRIPKSAFVVLGCLVVSLVFTCLVARDATITDSLSQERFFPFLSARQTVLALHILSGSSVILLIHLHDTALGLARWGLSTRSDRGISLLTFIALSNSTTLWGQIRLLFFGMKRDIRLFRRGSQILPPQAVLPFWAVHRLLSFFRYPLFKISKVSILLVVFQVVLASILFVNVATLPSYDRIIDYTRPGNISLGLGPIATSLANTPHAQFGGGAAIAFSYNGILSDANHIVSAPIPSECLGDTPNKENCVSFFLPGGTDIGWNIGLFSDPGYLPEATVWIQDDAPGYKLDFYTPANWTDIILTTDCHLYGVDQAALQFCITTNNTDLVLGAISISLVN